MRTTPNLSLKVWNDVSDQFSSSDLSANWDKIDADYTRARPANQAEVLAAVPSSSNFDGRLVYLTAADSGFPSKTLIRYDGSAWRSVGPHEILAAVPATGNYAGRMVLLSGASGGFAAWTLIRYDGSSWAQPNRGVDVSATVPVTNNYAGRIVVLSAADSGFNAWDVIRYNGSTWARIGPSPIPPATELVYQSYATDQTTAATTLNDLFTFSGATFENVKYYFDIRIPNLRASTSNNGITFQLMESATPVGNPVIFDTHQTAGVGVTAAALVPFTPSAASHTYKVQWKIGSAGTATIKATSSGDAVFRIIKG